jgi:hypothetical protein
MAAAWSAGASRMELAAIEDRNRRVGLYLMDFEGLLNSDF